MARLFRILHAENSTPVFSAVAAVFGRITLWFWGAHAPQVTEQHALHQRVIRRLVTCAAQGKDGETVVARQNSLSLAPRIV